MTSAPSSTSPVAVGPTTGASFHGLVVATPVLKSRYLLEQAIPPTNLFHFYKLKRHKTKKSRSFVKHYRIGSSSRVVVISPLKRKNSAKSANSPLPRPNSSGNSSLYSPRLPTYNARKQQRQSLGKSQSLLDLYMKSDYAKVDTTHDDMPIRVSSQRIYQRLGLEP